MTEGRPRRGYRVDIVCDQKHAQRGGGAPRRTLIATGEAMGDETRTAIRWDVDGTRSEFEVPANPPWRLVRASASEHQSWSRGRWTDPGTAVLEAMQQQLYFGARSEALEAEGFTWSDDPRDLGVDRTVLVCPTLGCGRRVVLSDGWHLYAVLDRAAADSRSRLTLAEVRDALEAVNRARGK